MSPPAPFVSWEGGGRVSGVVVMIEGVLSVFATASLDFWDWMTDRVYDSIAGPNGLIWVKRKFLR